MYRALVLCFSLAACALPALAEQTRIVVKNPTPPIEAPAWQLKTPSGKTVNFPEDAQGRPTVLLFWPSWCPFSRALQPYVQDIWEDYSGRVNVWTINILENGDPVQTMQDRGLSFPLLLDGDPLRDTYKIIRTPWLVVINGDNRIVYTRPKSPPSPIAVAKDVREKLNELLGEQAVPLPESYPEPYTLHLQGGTRSSDAEKPKPPAPTSDEWQSWLEHYLAQVDTSKQVADEPNRGAVGDGKTAIRIVREIWSERYGKKLMIAQAPHRAYRENNTWVVIGTTDSGKLGDGLVLVITADDGRVVRIENNQ